MGKTGLLTYEPYYGLAEKPFSLSTRPGALYRSESHAPVHDDLSTAIRRREGLIVLTGEIGTGKTTLCRSVLAGLDRKTFTTFVPDPFLTREDLLKMLLVEFGVVSVEDLVRGRLAGASRPDLSYPLYDFLKSLEPIDAFAVLIIDEAQHLPLPLLEEIRILSDLEDRRKLLQVVLIGQPELRDALALPHMRQVRQRVSMHRDLQPLSRDGVAGYVGHRLTLAGAERDRVAFTAEGIDRVFAVSNGVPRVINLICDRALHHGALRQMPRIGPELVATAAADLRMASGADLPPASAVATAPPPSASRHTRERHVPTVRTPESPDATAGVEAAAPAADAALSSAEGPLGSEQAAEFDHLLAMAPTVVRRGPPPAGPARGRQPVSLRGFVGELGAEGERASLADRLRRVPALVVVALTALGVLAGGSLAIYVLWARPLLHARVALPPVESRRSATGSGARRSVSKPPPPVSLPGEFFDEEPIVRAEAAPTPTTAPGRTGAAGTAAAWVVQVGAFASAERVRALRADLLAKGFESEERPVTDGGLTAVMVGPYASAAAAADARVRLQQGPGFEGAVVRRVARSR
jgi:general secretion pathway protein A